jgi:hypothetical protein
MAQTVSVFKSENLVRYNLRPSVVSLHSSLPPADHMLTRSRRQAIRTPANAQESGSP